MPNSVKVALIQNCAERDVAPSVAAVEPLIRTAAKDKAQFILLPEMVAMLEPDSAKVLQKTVSEAEDPALKAFRALARGDRCLDPGRLAAVQGTRQDARGEPLAAGRSLGRASPRATTSCISSTWMSATARPPRSAGRRARRARGAGRDALGPRRPLDLLTSASPISTARWPRPAPHADRARRLHLCDRQGALACPGPRPRNRDRQLRAGARPDTAPMPKAARPGGHSLIIPWGEILADGGGGGRHRHRHHRPRPGHRSPSQGPGAEARPQLPAPGRPVVQSKAGALWRRFRSRKQERSRSDDRTFFARALGSPMASPTTAYRLSALSFGRRRSPP